MSALLCLSFLSPSLYVPPFFFIYFSVSLSYPLASPSLATAHIFYFIAIFTQSVGNRVGGGQGSWIRQNCLRRDENESQFQPNLIALLPRAEQALHLEHLNKHSDYAEKKKSPLLTTTAFAFRLNVEVISLTHPRTCCVSHSTLRETFSLSSGTKALVNGIVLHVAYVVLPLRCDYCDMHQRARLRVSPAALSELSANESGALWLSTSDGSKLLWQSSTGQLSGMSSHHALCSDGSAIALQVHRVKADSLSLPPSLSVTLTKRGRECPERSRSSIFECFYDGFGKRCSTWCKMCSQCIWRWCSINHGWSLSHKRHLGCVGNTYWCSDQQTKGLKGLKFMIRNMYCISLNRWL